ncbi:hypothetical protein [Xanthomonas arboricola]|uniref:hypothetical protein n=1 Tax=Xanthomonas arboricola TaxID=56448 RepID=UPI003EC06897
MTQELPNAREFLLKTPLYATFDYSGEEVWHVLSVLYFVGTYDNYCVKCKRESTFQVVAPNRPDEYVRNEQREKIIAHNGGKFIHPKIPLALHTVHAMCTRDNSHTQDFIFLTQSEFRHDELNNLKIASTVQKIGQQPSFGDVHIAKVKKYAPVLSKPQLQELNRAIGLASHDVGVGSYVYLRRVFEALVEEAHSASRTDPGWDEEAYSRSRMSEKITLLRHQLPTFLGDHPEMYSLLSKGVHELSEEECLTHFDTLRIGIELILDDKLERRIRDMKINEAKAALAKAVNSARA